MKDILRCHGNFIVRQCIQHAVHHFFRYVSPKIIVIILNHQIIRVRPVYHQFLQKKSSRLFLPVSPYLSPVPLNIHWCRAALQHSFDLKNPAFQGRPADEHFFLQLIHILRFLFIRLKKSDPKGTHPLLRCQRHIHTIPQQRFQLPLPLSPQPVALLSGRFYITAHGFQPDINCCNIRPDGSRSHRHLLSKFLPFYPAVQRH